MNDFFDSAATKWDSICFHDPARLFWLMRMAGLDAARFRAGGGRILDVGTGTGVLVPFIRNFSDFEIDAADSSGAMLAAAREKLKSYRGVNFVECDACDPGAPIYSAPGRYEAIFLYSVVPHFEDRAKVFGLLAKALSPRGTLAVFHSESRAAINGCHESACARAGYEVLPPAALMAAEMADAGLTAKYIIDTEYSYLITSEKSRG